jgi:hypothetical protein
MPAAPFANLIPYSQLPPQAQSQLPNTNSADIIVLKFSIDFKSLSGEYFLKKSVPT